MAEKMTERLATRISPGVDQRLRVYASLTGTRLSHILDRALDVALPSADALADQIRRTSPPPAVPSERQEAGAAA